MIARVLSVLIGYVFGNFQSSYILVKTFKKKDIRDIGSHNAGTMNTTLNEGIGLGAATFVLDVLKTVAASFICVKVFGGTLSRELILAYACLGTALGHEFPFWLGFRGGKGVAVALAFLVMFDYRILLITVIVTLAVLAATKKLWLGSTAISVIMSVGAFCLYPVEVGIVVTVQAALIVILHLVHLEPEDTKF